MPLVPKDGIYHGLAGADDIFRDELFASAYSSIGRPATSPGMLTKVLLLQFHDNASDRQAEEHALYDLRWKHALHLSLGESGFDYSTLSVFRARLLLSQTDNVAFRQILDAAAERGLISREAAEQIFDFTHTLGAGAVQDTYTPVRTPHT